MSYHAINLARWNTYRPEPGKVSVHPGSRLACVLTQWSDLPKWDATSCGVSISGGSDCGFMRSLSILYLLLRTELEKVNNFFPLFLLLGANPLRCVEIP